jgi:histone-lysine N-methyltransferase SETMAR
MEPLVEEWLPEHGTFNRTYFCEVIKRRLASVVLPYQAIPRKQRFYLHGDNARPHNPKTSVQCINDSKLKRMRHPAYSPDIASSDFYHFGAVKQRLQSCQGRLFEELQENVHEILRSARPTELAAPMRAWIERLQKVTYISGEHVSRLN